MSLNPPAPLSRADLRADQRIIADDPARFRVVACGRRWGKTTLGLILAIEAARAGGRVWWVAPTYGLAFQPWRDLKRLLIDDPRSKLESERHIDLTETGGSITVQSADDPDSLRGVGLDFAVIDEAAFMAEEAWTAALRPALADRTGRALIISTPRGRNWFFRAHQRGVDPLIEGWMGWHHPTASNPRIGAEEIAEARRTLPERIFQQEYLAAFLEDGGSVFRSVSQAATAPLNAPLHSSHRYVMGIDFARYEDFTACVVIDTDTREVVALDRFSEMNWGVQRMRIATLARRWNISGILAEANAMGEPNIEMLRREGLPISGFVTTAASKPPLIEGLNAAIENQDVRLIPDPVLLGELESYTYSTTRFGQTIYSGPPDGHDDTVIALALAWKLAQGGRIGLGMVEI
jgi:phage terminase large subunit-like protein